MSGADGADRDDLKPLLIAGVQVDPTLVRAIPEQWQERHRFIPLAEKDGVLTLAMEDPENVQAIEDVELITRWKVVPVQASAEEIQTALDQYSVEVIMCGEGGCSFFTRSEWKRHQEKHGGPNLDGVEEAVE